MRKWAVAIGFYCMFIAACVGQDAPAQSSASTTTDDEALSAAPALSCPLNCNDSGCRLANGTCTIACNACLCKRRGGTPDNSCLTEADVVDDRGTEATTEALGGGQCGAATCRAGTHCCNPSCGICVPPGASCPQHTCD